MFLEQIGADAHIRELFEPHAAQRLELGRVRLQPMSNIESTSRAGITKPFPPGGCGMTLSCPRWVTGWQHGRWIQNWL
jgi:hypothetical protein